MGKITSSTTEIITKIRVYNPNSIPLPLKDILTEVYMNSIKMGEALKAEIKANSESTAVISTKLESSGKNKDSVKNLPDDFLCLKNWC